MVISKDFENETLPAANWWHYNFELIILTSMWSASYNKEMAKVWSKSDNVCWSYNTPRFPFSPYIFSPRQCQTIRDIKNPSQFFHPQCLEIMLTEFGMDRMKTLGWAFHNPEHAFFKHSTKPTSCWAECQLTVSCSGWWDPYVYEFWWL